MPAVPTALNVLAAQGVADKPLVPPTAVARAHALGRIPLGFGPRFYVAFLLANPHAEPITAMDLAAEVFEKFGEHEDFRPPIPKGYRNGARIAKILFRKEKRLEAIVDREDEDDVVRIEALRELIVLDELKRIYFSQVAREATNAGEAVSDALRELHATLATAVDARGNPHRVTRDFAMHLLHYVLMPSNRVSAKERVALFVYRPAGEGN